MPAEDERPTDSQPRAEGDREEAVRREAVKQIERRRRFHVELAASGIGMLVLAVIWAVSEYYNAGGWPTDGFSQSSSIPNVWNIWIIYPFIAWVLIMSARGWSVHGHRPISDEEIQREIDRQRGARTR